MTWLIVLAAVIVVVFLLYLLALRCEKRRGEWDYFRKWRYAHRGYHDKPRIPENSLPAFRRAVQLEGTEHHIPLLEEVLPIFAGKAPLIIELKAERGNADALAAAACALLDKYKGKYMVESFDPRCLMWLWHNRPQVLRGQLSENFLRHSDGANLPGVVRWVLSNLLMNSWTRPDFVAYRFEDRGCLSLKLCRGVYRAQEASWTIRDRADMDAAEAAGCLVIFECFDPRGLDT